MTNYYKKIAVAGVLALCLMLSGCAGSFCDKEYLYQELAYLQQHSAKINEYKNGKQLPHSSSLLHRTRIINGMIDRHNEEVGQFNQTVRWCKAMK